MPDDWRDPATAAHRTTVSVCGEAAIRTEPDEASVWITLVATEPSPGAALADVARRSDALVALLDGLGIPREDRSTAGINVHEDFDHTDQGRRSLGHRATATVSVRIADTEVIGRLMMRASDEVDARIAGPSWRVSPSNPAWLAAAKQAAASARERAAAYAAGVDARLGPLLTMAEPNYGPGRRVTAASARATVDMPVETGDQEVTATIQATFVLLTES